MVALLVIDMQVGSFAPATPRHDAGRVVHRINGLGARGERELLVTGCATDFCVDTTVRAALSPDYEVTVVSDAHTTADRPHLDAASIIRHHNETWRGLLHPRRTVAVRPADGIAAGLMAGTE